MGEQWVPPSKKEEAPPTMSTRPPEQGSGESGTLPLEGREAAGPRPSYRGIPLWQREPDLRRPEPGLRAQWNHLMTLRMFENSSVQTGCPGLVSIRFQRGSCTSFPSAAWSRATRTQIELAAPSLAAAGVTA